MVFRYDRRTLTSNWHNWKDEWMIEFHSRKHALKQEEADRQAEIIGEEEQKQRDEEQKNHEKMRKKLMMKVFSQTICGGGGVQDMGVMKEGFGLWKEAKRNGEMMNLRNQFEEEIGAKEERMERERDEREREQAEQKKAKSSMMVKYFSEKISPGIYDLSSKKESFGIWKEQFMYEIFSVQEERVKQELMKKHAEEGKRREEQFAKEREIHLKSRSAMMVQYFSDKISPEIHDGSAKTESFGLWKEELMHYKFAILEQQRLEMEERRQEEAAKQREEHTKLRAQFMVKYFAEKINPAVHDGAAVKEGFGVWKEEFMKWRFEKSEEQRIHAESRKREQDKKEREVHQKARGGMLIKYFAEKISPAVHDGAAVKEAFGVWKENFLQEKFLEKEERIKESLSAKHAAEVKRYEVERQKEREAHIKSRSGMMIKYFSDKISPEIHDESAKKEAFGGWKEEFMRDRYTKEEGQRQDAEIRRREEDAKERELHEKTRGGMLIKLFAEKISPEVVDVAAQKESFGVWKEDFMQHRFTQQEERLKEQLVSDKIREIKVREEEFQKEREIHIKARSGMMIKFFAEKFSPEIHDAAAVKESFGVWKEEFMRERFAKAEERRQLEASRKQEEASKERELHKKTRGNMVIRLFAEKISPEVHESAAVKEAFGVWKEDFMHHRFQMQEERMKKELIERHQDEIRRKNEEFEKEREIQLKSRSGMMVKYFSDKVSPGIYDSAAKKESFGVWKEQFTRYRYVRIERKLKAEIESREAAENSEKRKREEDNEDSREREIQQKSRSGMMVKYFSECVSPGLYDSAAKKESFGLWKEQFIHDQYLRREEGLMKEMKEMNAKHERLSEQKRREESLKKERELHEKARSGMIIKYFSDKVSPEIHDESAKKEAFGVWKQDWTQWCYVKVEEKYKTQASNQEERERNRREREEEQRKREQDLHLKSRKEMMIKYFSEKINPGLHDSASKKEIFGIWKEDFIHSRFRKQEEELKEKRKLELQAQEEKLRSQEQEAQQRLQDQEEKLKSQERENQEKLKQQRSQNVLQYWKQRAKPELAAAESKKKSFAFWQREWRSFYFDNLERQHKEREKRLMAELRMKSEEIKEREAEATKRRQEQLEKEQELRKEARSQMMIKYFSEKVNPGLHDSASRKESFGIWREGYLHCRYEVMERKIRNEMEEKQKAAEKQRNAMLEREREEKERQNEMHNQTRSDMIVKFFSESISPKVHDGAMLKSGFGMWKEQFVHFRYLVREEEIRREIELKMRAENEEETRRRDRKLVAFNEALGIHSKSRSDMIIKLFAEKISPSVNEVAMKKEGFGNWKENFVRWKFERNEEKRRNLKEKEEERRREEDEKEKDVHQKARSEMMIKYFSEKVSPGVYDGAMKKEGFGIWKEQVLNWAFVKREEELKRRMELREKESLAEIEEERVDIARQFERERATRDEEVKREIQEREKQWEEEEAKQRDAWDQHVQSMHHEKIRNQKKEQEESERKAMEKQEEEEKQRIEDEKQQARELEAKLQSQSRSIFLMKMFSEKISPSVNEKASKSQSFSSWKESFLRKRERSNLENTRLELEEKTKEESREERQKRKELAKKRNAFLITMLSPMLDDSPIMWFQAWRHEYHTWKEETLQKQKEEETTQLRQAEESARKKAEEEIKKATDELTLKQEEAEKMKQELEETRKQQEEYFRTHEIVKEERDRETHAVLQQTRLQAQDIRNSHQSLQLELGRYKLEHKMLKKIHREYGKDKLERYFREKIVPSVYDDRKKKDAFDDWKDQFMRDKFELENDCEIRHVALFRHDKFNDQQGGRTLRTMSINASEHSSEPAINRIPPLNRPSSTANKLPTSSSNRMLSDQIVPSSEKMATRVEQQEQLDKELNRRVQESIEIVTEAHEREKAYLVDKHKKKSEHQKFKHSLKLQEKTNEMNVQHNYEKNYLRATIAGHEHLQREYSSVMKPIHHQTGYDLAEFSAVGPLPGDQKYLSPPRYGLASGGALLELPDEFATVTLPVTNKPGDVQCVHDVQFPPRRSGILTQNLEGRRGISTHESLKSNISAKELNPMGEAWFDQLANSKGSVHAVESVDETSTEVGGDSDVGRATTIRPVSGSLRASQIQYEDL